MGGDNKDKKEVSTHAPLAGSDDTTAQAATHHNVSTHAPLAGSDWYFIFAINASGVSTHAPLAGSDISLALFSPCAQFQPTLPLRGATRLPSANSVGV